MTRPKDMTGQLTEEQRAIRSWLKRIGHPTKQRSRVNPDSSGPDPGDEMDQTQRELLREQEARTYARLASRVAALDHALESVQRQTYGKCQKCGAKIPRRRLKAVPGAAFCVACQEDLEQVTHKGRRGWGDTTRM